MPSQKKLNIVASLKEKLQKGKSVILTDYRGLTHQQIEQLRSSLKNLKAQFIVVKNSLLKLALEDSGLFNTAGIRREPIGADPADFSGIQGPTAVLITTTDDLSPLRAVHQKGQELNALKIKWGVWQGEIIDKDQVIRLATLPNREVLLGQVVAQLSSPKSRLVYALKGNFDKLVLILKGVKKSD